MQTAIWRIIALAGLAVVLVAVEEYSFACLHAHNDLQRELIGQLCTYNDYLHARLNHH